MTVKTLSMVDDAPKTKVHATALIESSASSKPIRPIPELTVQPRKVRHLDVDEVLRRSLPEVQG